MRRLLGLAMLYLLVAALAPAAENVTVTLNRGWNAVGFQVQRLTQLSANPAVRGFVTWNGSGYTTGNFALADLNRALAGRQGVWVLADEPTSFTYSGTDDGAGGGVPLGLNGYQLVTFCTGVDIPSRDLFTTQNGEGRPLPPLLEIGPNNEYVPVDGNGVLKPGRAYWALADTRLGTLRLNPPGSLGRIRGQVEEAPGFQVVVLGGGSTRVNPDGTFTVENVEPGPQTVTIVSAEGHQAAVVTVDVRPGQTSDAGLIAPRSSGLVSGIVSSRSGSALAGVSVVATPLLSVTEPVLGTENGRPRLFARTNARGEYSLRGLVPGDYLVTASLAGFLDSSQTVRVAARQAVSANFELEPARGAAVRGRVTLQGGTPLRGAVVSLARADFPRPLPPEPIPGPSVIQVDPVPPVAIGPVETTPGGTFTAPGGPENTPVNQLLPPGTSPGAPVPIGSPGVAPPIGIPPVILPPPSRPPLVTFTDAEGRYQLDAVPPGTYLLRVYKFGLEPASEPVTLLADQVLVHDVVLVDNHGILEGRVTIKGNGAPVEGANLSAWPGDIFDPVPLPVPLVPIDTPTTSPGSPPPGGEAGGLAAHPPFRGFAVTDRDGHYQLKLPAGSYLLSVFAQEFAEQSLPVQVKVGETVRTDFQLEPAGGSPVEPVQPVEPVLPPR